MLDDVRAQGTFLTSLFTFVFTVLDNEEQFHARLIELAESHCRRGVKSCEYSIMGDVMFWSLKQCLGKFHSSIQIYLVFIFFLLGPGIYTYEVHTSWVKVFSKMLSVIVPISVQNELLSNVAQQERLNAFITMTKQSDQPKTDECPFGFSESVMKESVDPLHNINVKNITNESSMATSKKSLIKNSKIVPITAETTPMMSVRRLW